MSFADAAMAFRLTADRAAVSLGPPLDIGESNGGSWRLMRVVLGDSMQCVHSVGGAASLTLRERMQRSHAEADVLVDSRAPILQALVQWARAQQKASGAKKNRVQLLRFFTDSEFEFHTLEKVLAVLDIKVRDGAFVLLLFYSPPARSLLMRRSLVMTTPMMALNPPSSFTLAQRR